MPKLLADVNMENRNSKTGYMPHLVTKEDGDYMGVRFLGDMNRGLNVDVLLETMYDDRGVDYSTLIPGVEFEIREGRAVMGRGIITGAVS